MIIPDKDRLQILKQIHEGHLGIQKCLHRAKATVYWPKLYDKLKYLVTNCATCLKYSASNRKDSTKIGPPLGQEIPTQPWKKLATDLFTYDHANYLPIVEMQLDISINNFLKLSNAKWPYAFLTRFI